MLIQIHALQNYVPANLNRDDTGSPKDALFGGYLRGRISSQCLKRSIRRGSSSPFRTAFEADGLLGERTQQLPALVRAALQELGASKEAMDAIVARVPEIGRESSKKQDSDESGDELSEGADAKGTAAATDTTKQLIFLDRTTEVAAMARKLLALQTKHGKAWAKLKIDEITRELGNVAPRSVDIALFGRMTTSAAFANVQASAQVAHALSTNAIKQEFDYFTAMDDLKPLSEPGAGLIGDTEYNSACYYKYANVHWDGLLGNLGNDVAVARRAVLAFLEGFIFAQPTGKQNTFAAHNLPDFVLVEVSPRNLPVNYANAFLKPVTGFAGHSLVANSVEALSEHVGRLSAVYGLAPERAYLTVSGDAFLDLKSEKSLATLRSWLEGKLPTKA